MPEQSLVWLDPFSQEKYFETALPRGLESVNRVTFLDNTRLDVRMAGFTGELHLAAGSSLRWQGEGEQSVFALQGAHFAHHQGRLMVAITAPQARVRLLRQPHMLRQCVLHLQVPDAASIGDAFQVRVAQKNEASVTPGGVTLRVVVTRP